MNEFARALWSVTALQCGKSKDYGTDQEPFQNIIDGAEFAGIEPWVAAMLRANDKMGRLRQTAQGGQQLYDSAQDDFLDIATYALIAYCLYNRQADGPIEELTASILALSNDGWPVPVSDD